MARVPSIQRGNHKMMRHSVFFYEKYKRGKKGDKDVHMVVKIENKKENMRSCSLAGFLVDSYGLVWCSSNVILNIRTTIELIIRFH
jgi:hypothetical protein